MKAARLAKLIPLLTVPLAAMTLAAPATAGIQVAAHPTANSALAGYLWSGSTTPSGPLGTYYTYDSAGGAVSVTTSSPGVYVASFPGLGSVAGKAIVQVTPYSTGDTCAVVGWGRAGTAMHATVACFNASGGQNPAEFTLMVTRPVTPPTGAFAYSWVYKRSGILTSYQYNSTGRKNSVTNPSVGHYVVTLPGGATSGTHGSVMVSAYGDEGGTCTLGSWRGTSVGQIVNVTCRNSTGHFQTRDFMVTAAASNNLMGQNGKTGASALANGSAAVYQPAVQFNSAHGGRVTIVHLGTGAYEAIFAGAQGSATTGGTVQVNAVSTSNNHCVSGGWGQNLTPTAYIYCYDGHQHSVNSAFNVNWANA